MGRGGEGELKGFSWGCFWGLEGIFKWLRLLVLIFRMEREEDIEKKGMFEGVGWG